MSILIILEELKNLPRSRKFELFIGQAPEKYDYVFDNGKFKMYFVDVGEVTYGEMSYMQRLYEKKSTDGEG